jgi:DNA-directed RNA polymerase subunit RPC12/RpoP
MKHKKFKNCNFCGEKILKQKKVTIKINTGKSNYIRTIYLCNLCKATLITIINETIHKNKK